jgi:hypothetical protein
VVEAPGAVEAEFLPKSHATDDLVEWLPLLSDVDPEAHGASVACQQP